MSAFLHNFNHGFFHGMFNGMFGGLGMFNWCGWNSAQMFFTPNYSAFNFFQYQSPILMPPSIWNYNAPNFTASTFSCYPQCFDYSVNCTKPDSSSSLDCPCSFDNDKTTKDDDNKKVRKEKIEKEEKIVVQTDEDFDKMLDCVLKSEGGYNPNDCGQAGNKGVQQSTYDQYRKSKGLHTRNVKLITNDEVKDLYYTMFYQASGADKIKDARMALYVFDTAVNMGVSAAKNIYNECDGNLDKFEELRIAKYESIAAKNNGAKQKYLNGWKNRVADVEEYANKVFIA